MGLVSVQARAADMKRRALVIDSMYRITASVAGSSAR